MDVYLLHRKNHIAVHWEIILIVYFSIHDIELKSADVVLNGQMYSMDDVMSRMK